MDYQMYGMYDCISIQTTIATFPFQLPISKYLLQYSGESIIMFFIRLHLKVLLKII